VNTTEQQALRSGYAQWDRRRRKAAIARVLTFERWLKNGSKLGQIPCVPSDNDYNIARAAGAITRGTARRF
jgi:hypothetical protein